MTTALVVPDSQSLEEFRQGILAEYENERDEAQADYEELRERGGNNITMLSRAHNRKLRAERKIEAVQEGFLPVPRMPVQDPEAWANHGVMDRAPEVVQERLRQVREAGTFERIAIVLPTHSGRARRDPLLIGIIGPGTAREEHFLIAWWR